MSVVPMHAASNGTCTCGSAECHSPGKHPRIRWQRLVDAPAGEEEVARWWSRWPAANVAVVTGRVSGVVVLDVDPRGGGDASLAALEDRWGRLPPAPETLTGGGGRHVWMRSGGDDLPTARVAPGLDLKAHAGLVTVPPSVHPSGSPYRWRPGAGPEDRDPPPVPQWLSRLALGLVDQEPGTPSPTHLPARASSRPSSPPPGHGPGSSCSPVTATTSVPSTPTTTRPSTSITRDAAGTASGAGAAAASGRSGASWASPPPPRGEVGGAGTWARRARRPSTGRVRST
jgi:bifunctional DNA primase/polymerase-like protein